MSIRPIILRSGPLLLASEVIVQGAGLARNLLVARAISPANFGIASVLAMTVSLVELLGDIGAGRFLSRLPDSASIQFLSSSHSLNLIRGLTGAALLFILAAPLASFLQMSEHVGAFYAVSLLPLVRSFGHNDIWLLQRERRFLAFVTCQCAPQIVALLAAPLAVAYAPDYRAILVLLFLSSITAIVTSHLVARSAYTISFDTVAIKAMLVYGWPLTIDACLMFFVMHGERVIMAREYGAATLGVYSAALLLAGTPALAASRIGLSLGVPLLRKRDGETSQRACNLAAATELFTSLAVSLSIFFAVAGDLLMRAVYGPNYSIPYLLTLFLGLAFALRLARAVPAIAALADGITSAPMLGNLGRVASLVPAFIFARSGADSWTVLACAAAGELTALVLTARLVAGPTELPVRISLAGATIVVLGAGIGWLARLAIDTAQWSPATTLVAATALSALALLSIVGASPRLRCRLLPPSWRFAASPALRTHSLPATSDRC